MSQVWLAVRYAQTNRNTGSTPDYAANSPYGEVLSFDFSNECSQYDGTVLAYGVALTGFMLDYETNSVYYAEKVGHLGVRLVPNLVGSIVTATANATITDYDGDAPSPGKNQKNPATMVQATAVALIGPNNQGSAAVLGNMIGAASGQVSVITAQNSASNNYAFLSGFSLSSTSPGSINGISCGATASAPSGGNFNVGGSSSISGLIKPSTATDIMVLSFNPAMNLQIQQVPIAWGSVKADKQNGMTAAFTSPTFTIPAGMTVKNVALVPQYLNIQLTGQAQIQLVGATQIGSLTTSVSGSKLTVSGQYNLCIYNPDAGETKWIDSGSSNAILYVIAQFG